MKSKDNKNTHEYVVIFFEQDWFGNCNEDFKIGCTMKQLKLLNYLERAELICSHSMITIDYCTHFKDKEVATCSINKKIHPTDDYQLYKLEVNPNYAHYNSTYIIDAEQLRLIKVLDKGGYLYEKNRISWTIATDTDIKCYPRFNFEVDKKCETKFNYFYNRCIMMGHESPMNIMPEKKESKRDNELLER